MKNTLLIAALLLGSYSAKAQDLEHQAPTLQIGLNGFNMSKGTLDAALIMEIIAEKQGELKLKTIQNLFLNRVIGAGGTVYAFVDNSLHQIVDEKDQDIRTRKIFENTVNFVFVCTYLEFYLREMDSASYESVRKLALFFKDTLAASKPSPFSIKNFYKEAKSTVGEGVDMESVDNSHDLDLTLIPLLIDIASEVVRNNANLNKLGVMEQSYTDSYEYLNEYLIMKRDTNCIAKFKAAQELYTKMSARLQVLTNNIGYISYLYDQFDFSIDANASILQNDIYMNLFDSLLLRTNELIVDLSKDKVDVLKDPKIAQEIKNLIGFRDFVNKAQTYLNKNPSLTIENSKTVSEILYSLSKKYADRLKSQAYRHADYQKVLSEMETANEFISRSFNRLKILDDETIQLVTEDKFLSLVAKLYQFDKISSITEYLKLMEELIGVLPNDNVVATLKTIVTFTKDYTVVNKNDSGEEVLSFNAESFIMKLQSIKPYSLNRWEFLFTVGTNQTYFKYDINITDSLTGVSNMAFVGEKIGLKFKIIDKEFSWNRNPGETFAVSTLRHPFKKVAYQRLTPPKEPIISNFHAIVYGTGLLYNLVNTSTNKSFNLPMFGAGLGLTFYNGLDLNVSVGIPILSNAKFSRSYDYTFFNVGFDIQFIEYYNRLMKKRNTNQTQKRLSEARQN